MTGAAGGHHRSQLRLERRIGRLQQSPDGLADQSDGVHGRHCIVGSGGFGRLLRPMRPTSSGAPTAASKM
jgi:hypothetical protein